MPELSPTEEIQLHLEQIHFSNQTLSKLRKTFSQPVIIDHLREHGIPLDFGLEFLAQIGLHRRANFKTMFGLLHHHFSEGKDEGLQNCADMIEAAIEAGLCNYDPLSREMTVAVAIPADVQAELDKFQYPMPMVCKPKPLSSNRHSAYLTGGSGVILKRYNHHDDDVCLDHLNRLNCVELCLNMDTARMIENTWSNLQRQKDDETRDQYLKKVKAFVKYDTSARDVMQFVFISGNKFHMTHRYDKRGRTYAQGYHINPQGNEWNKAVVEFSTKELVDG